MGKYEYIKVNITPGQHKKIAHALENNLPTSIKLSKEDFDGPYELAVTLGQLNRMKKAYENGKGIIMCTHFPDHVLAIADQAVILKDGSLIARGRADEIINEENIYQAYGIHAVIGSLENYPGHKICRVLCM